MSLSDDKQADNIDAFNTIARYLDGLSFWFDFLRPINNLSVM